MRVLSPSYLKLRPVIDWKRGGEGEREGERREGERGRE